MQAVLRTTLFFLIAAGFMEQGMAAPIYSWGRQLTSLDTPGGPYLTLNYGQAISDGQTRTWSSSGTSSQNSAITWTASGTARVDGYSVGAASSLTATLPAGLPGRPSIISLTAVGLEDSFSILPGSLLSNGFVRLDFLIRGSASYFSNDAEAERSLFIASFDFRGPEGSIGILNNQFQFPFTSTIKGEIYKGSFLIVDGQTNFSESVVSLLIPYSPTITLSYLLRAGASTPFNLTGGTYSINVNLLNTATLIGADLYAGTIQSPGERIADAVISGSDGTVIPTAIPEPATGVLLCGALFAVALGARRNGLLR